MKKNNLIAMAQSFVSFLIDKIEIDQAILFGSVSSGEFDEESDIDLFIETEKKNEKRIKEILELYKKSDSYEKYQLLGIKNNLSLKIGKLEEWASLKRNIIGNGIVLYGKYKETPGKLTPYIIFSISYKNLERKDKIKIWRYLYGYKQKVGKKYYEKKGIAKIKLGNSCIVINLEKKYSMINLFKKYKINYKIYEIWSDNIN